MTGMADGDTKKTCQQCGGELTRGTLKTGNQEANIIIAGKADGFLGVIPYTTAQVTARVCVSCGHIDLYARNVQDLLQMDSET